MKVKEIMTTAVVTVNEGTSVKDIAGVLARRRISAVPVIDGKGALVGIVSEYDLLARQGKARGQGSRDHEHLPGYPESRRASR